VIVNNSTNIIKANNHISPQLIEHKKDNDHIWVHPRILWGPCGSSF